MLPSYLMEKIKKEKWEEEGEKDRLTALQPRYKRGKRVQVAPIGS